MPFFVLIPLRRQITIKQQVGPFCPSQKKASSRLLPVRLAARRKRCVKNQVMELIRNVAKSLRCLIIVGSFSANDIRGGGLAFPSSQKRLSVTADKWENGRYILEKCFSLFSVGNMILACVIVALFL